MTANRRYQAMLDASLAFYAAEKIRGHQDYGGRFFVGKHHLEWSELVAKHRKLRILAPRDHSKSQTFSLAYPLWMVEKHPGDEEAGYIFSNTQRNAEKLLRKIKREVENNPKLVHLLPDDRSDQWSASCLKFKNGHIIYAHGAGTAARGGHPRWIVVDDILGDKVATSPVVREGVTDYVFSVVEPMLIPGGQMIVVGTPLASDDVYAALAKPEVGFACYAYPAVDKNWEHALWPERYPVPALRAKLAFHGSLRFSREYLCVAQSNLSSLFPDELFDRPQAYRHDVSLGWSKKRLQEELGIVAFFMGTDYGISASAKADSTVNWCWGLDAHGNHWIVDIHEATGLSYDEQRVHSERMGLGYDVVLAYSEAVQAQRMFGENLQAETDVPVELFHTGADKHSLEKGVPALRLPLERGKVRLPVGDERSKTLIAKWRSQMQGFVIEGGRVVSTTAHDDLAMASWLAWRASKDGRSFDFSTEPEPGDDASEELFEMGLTPDGQPLPASTAAPAPPPDDGEDLDTADTDPAPAGDSADLRDAKRAAAAERARHAVPGGSWLSFLGFG